MITLLHPPLVSHKLFHPSPVCLRHDYNDYQLLLRVHVDERDGLLNKIDRTSQRLHLLRNTNVFNDAFKIW
jgi:hypothetical protein